MHRVHTLSGLVSLAIMASAEWPPPNKQAPGQDPHMPLAGHHANHGACAALSRVCLMATPGMPTSL